MSKARTTKVKITEVPEFGYGESGDWPERIEHDTLGLPDLNTAPEHRIAALPGVGRARAKLIIDYREKHGAFNMLYDLRKLGFDDALIEGLRGRVLVGGRIAA